MKIFINYKKTWLSITTAIFLTAISIGFYACKKPTDGVNVIVNTGTLSKSPVLIHFTNANLISTTQPGDFSVSITGKDSAMVQMDGGGTKFAASHGFLPLSLTRAAHPSTSTPATFNVTANVPGFTPITQTITLSNDTVTKVYEIKLIEYANPAAGTTALVSSATLNSGATTGVVNLTTPTTASVAQNATLSIPAGTQMLDANGSVINAGNLAVNIVQFAPSTPSIINSFPGGMKADLALDQNGKPIPGGVNFVTGGMLAINMTAGNTPVKSFSKPVSMSIELQPGVTNFANGNTIAVGDTIPLWSYNENTGIWKKEGTATAYLDGSNKLAAKANISHLSYWNLDWSWGSFGGYNTTNRQFSINLTPGGSATVGNWNGLYEVELQTPYGNYLAGFHSYQPQYDYFQSQYIYYYNYYWYGYNYSWYGYYYATNYSKYGFGLANLPSTTQAKVAVYDIINGYTKVGESAVFNPLTTNSVSVNVTTPPPPDYVNVQFNIKGRCSSKSIDVGVSGWFYLWDYTAATRGQRAYSYIYIYNGVIYNYSYNNNTQLGSTNGQLSGSLKMVNGDLYYLESWNNNSWYSTSFTFTKQGFTLPANNTISGSVAYNSNTNTSTVNAVFNVNCN